MKRYIAMVDLLGKSGYEYFELNAQNIIEAMDEACDLYDEKKVYLIKLLEKSGRVKRKKYGIFTPFTSLLINRGFGWNTTTEKNGERKVTVIQRKYEYKSKEYETGFVLYDIQ